MTDVYLFLAFVHLHVLLRTVNSILEGLQYVNIENLKKCTNTRSQEGRRTEPNHSEP